MGTDKSRVMVPEGMTLAQYARFLEATVATAVHEVPREARSARLEKRLDRWRAMKRRGQHRVPTRPHDGPVGGVCPECGSTQWVSDGESHECEECGAQWGRESRRPLPGDPEKRPVGGAYQPPRPPRGEGGGE